MKRIPLGALEELVLLAVQASDGPASASFVKATLQEDVDAFISTGCLYTTIERLRIKELLALVEVPKRPVQGGRAHSAFTVTTTGQAALRSAEEKRARLRSLQVLPAE